MTMAKGEKKEKPNGPSMDKDKIVQGNRKKREGMGKSSSRTKKKEPQRNPQQQKNTRDILELGKPDMRETRDLANKRRSVKETRTAQIKRKTRSQREKERIKRIDDAIEIRVELSRTVRNKADRRNRKDKMGKVATR